MMIDGLLEQLLAVTAETKAQTAGMAELVQESLASMGELASYYAAPVSKPIEPFPTWPVEHGTRIFTFDDCAKWCPR